MITQEKNKEELVLKMRDERRKKKQKKVRRQKIGVVSMIMVIAIISAVICSASATAINITEINEFDGVKKTRTVYTMKRDSVGEVLSKENVTIGDNDRINVGVDDAVSDNDEIIITRGKEITIVADGVETSAVVTKADAHDALVEAGYIPGEADEISVENGEDLKDSSKVQLISVSSTVEAVNEEIQNEVLYIDDPTMPEGETKVIEEGSIGTRQIKSNVLYRSGEEVSRELVSDTVVTEPKNRVIAIGKKKSAVPAISRSGGVTESNGTINGMSYSRKITMSATAYSTSPSENGGYTVSAMGNKLGFGIVAVDPSVIPLGSKVFVTSTDGSWTYGVASAEDTGGAIKGNKIDLCYDGTPSSVNQFGRRSCVVYVLN